MDVGQYEMGSILAPTKAPTKAPSTRFEEEHTPYDFTNRILLHQQAEHTAIKISHLPL